MHAQPVSELDLPYLDTIGLERREAVDAISEARARHWLARTELGYSVINLQDVTSILRDQRFHSALSMLEQAPELQDSDYQGPHGDSILTMEGDAHARLRRLVAPAFTPASANRLRPTMRTVVGTLVGPRSPTGASVSWWQTCASPTPFRSSANSSVHRPKTGSCFRPGRPTSFVSSTTTWPRTCRSSPRRVKSSTTT